MKDTLSPTPRAVAEKKIGSRRKRFQPNEAPSYISNPHAPVLILNDEGTIAHVTLSARRLLEYSEQQTVDPCFFSHVHGKNLYRVMRDVADMVCHGKESGTWLLRLRTGRGRWRWYKAAVRNYLNEETPGISVALHDLHEW